jgi:hypothetical protein
MLKMYAEALEYRSAIVVRGILKEELQLNEELVRRGRRIDQQGEAFI